MPGGDVRKDAPSCTAYPLRHGWAEGFSGDRRGWRDPDAKATRGPSKMDKGTAVGSAVKGQA